jgi:hypothetical protein
LITNQLVQARDNAAVMETKNRELISVISLNKAKIDELEAETKEQSTATAKLLRQISEIRADQQYWRNKCAEKISYREFAANDVVLFLRTPHGFYRAFPWNSAIPYFAAQDSVVAAEMKAEEARRIAEAKGTEDKQESSEVIAARMRNSSSGPQLGERLLGRIICVENHVSSAESNPYQLDVGTEYCKLIVEPISDE